ncbi:hypothetical protein HYX17_03720 [Candidatus Woesearchaeota archaeon]|nr:hypothetical protein [Candidatus Woesearchaeota archaeon]
MDKKRLEQLSKLEEAISQIKIQISRGYGCWYRSTNHDTAGLCEVHELRCPYMNENLSCGYDRKPTGKDLDGWEEERKIKIGKERELASRSWIARKFSKFYK